MQKLRLWDVLNLHSFQSILADTACLYISEQTIS